MWAGRGLERVSTPELFRPLVVKGFDMMLVTSFENSNFGAPPSTEPPPFSILGCDEREYWLLINFCLESVADVETPNDWRVAMIAEGDI